MNNWDQNMYQVITKLSGSLDTIQAHEFHFHSSEWAERGFLGRKAAERAAKSREVVLRPAGHIKENEGLFSKNYL